MTTWKMIVAAGFLASVARADAPGAPPTSAPSVNVLTEHLLPAQRAKAPKDGNAPNRLRLHTSAIIETACRAAAAQPDRFAVAQRLGVTAAREMTTRGTAALAFDIAGDAWFRDGLVASLPGPGGSGTVVLTTLSMGKDRPGFALDVDVAEVVFGLGFGEQPPLTERWGDGMAFKKLALIAMSDSFQAFKAEATPGPNSTHVDEEAMARHRAGKPKMDPDWLLRVVDFFYDYTPKGGPTCRLVLSTFAPEAKGETMHLARIQVIHPLVPLPPPDRPRAIE